ncbi:amidoligase family protein [Catenovulum sediminis]|uniref:Amidoligase family protein n=1 Tax=Catenovulum sediminis TaxID=1740262 RepID=A0ABV1RE23_9ALTE|nr:amidoligase family protein [Catenovulum sediminis]
MKKDYKLPTVCKNKQADYRTVGFELEFAGVSIQKVAQTIADKLSTEYHNLNDTEYTVKVSDVGTFKVELDWRYAKIKARQRAQLAADGQPPADFTDEASDRIMRWLTDISTTLVPVEIVCPPIQINQLDLIDPVIYSLRKQGASGTDESVLYAFGVHINTELPDLSAATIANYLKAYIVCEEWLIKKHKVDLSRRVTPFIDTYPKTFKKCVLNYDDNVSVEQIINDYLKHNATRNRALDMLPLFRHIDDDKITKALPKEKINARPTFHYRLPNCHIGTSDWSLHESWNIWCVVEEIAHDTELLNQLAKNWLAHQKDWLQIDKPWHKELEKIYQN